MRRTHRLPARLIRWAKLCVYFALIGTGLTIISLKSSSSPNLSVASWLRHRLHTEAPQQVPIRKHDSARLKSIAQTHLERGSGIRLLLSIAAPLLVLDAPTNLNVYLASSTQISLSWTAPAGSVNHYQIERSASLSGPFTTIGTSATTSFDNTGLSGVHSYLYRVRAVDSFGAPSTPSNLALGTSIDFTDAQLSAGVTEIKAQH